MPLVTPGKTRLARLTFVLFLLLTHLGRGAAFAQPASTPSVAAPAATAAAAVRAGEAAIMAADRAFNQAVADGRRERFAALIAVNATFNGGTPDETRGRDAIVKSWEPFFVAGGPRLSWEPTSAHVLVGGDVGVTIGNWVRKVPQRDGSVVERRGQYLTTWQRQPDGGWLVTADLGSTAP